MSEKPKIPLSEGITRGSIKDGVQKPTTSTVQKPKEAPPPPKPKE